MSLNAGSAGNLDTLAEIALQTPGLAERMLAKAISGVRRVKEKTAKAKAKAPGIRAKAKAKPMLWMDLRRWEAHQHP